MAKRASRWLKPKVSEKVNFSLKIDQTLFDRWTKLEDRLEKAGQTINRAEVIEGVLADVIDELNEELDAQEKKTPVKGGN